MFDVRDGDLSCVDCGWREDAPFCDGDACVCGGILKEPKTIVVNLRKEKCDVKICRAPNNSIPTPPNAGCFGNPFFLKNVNDDAERDVVCDKHRDYFFERVAIDPEFLAAVRSLKGKRLGCFCKPKRCHGDTIVEFLEGR